MKTTINWLKRNVLSAILVALALFLLSVAAIKIQQPEQNRKKIEATQDTTKNLRKDIRQIQIDQVVHDAEKQEVLDAIQAEQKTMSNDLFEIKGMVKIIKEIVTK